MVFWHLPGFDGSGNPPLFALRATVYIVLRFSVSFLQRGGSNHSFYGLEAGWVIVWSGWDGRMEKDGAPDSN